MIENDTRVQRHFAFFVEESLVRNGKWNQVKDSYILTICTNSQVATNQRRHLSTQLLTERMQQIFETPFTMMGPNGSSKPRKGKNDRDKTTTTIIQRLSSRRISFHRAYASLGMLFLILLSVPTTNKRIFADAFARNLVDTKIGCMTDLSTDEVIMNEEVIPPEESDFPKMHLAVLDDNENPIDKTTFEYEPSAKTIQIAFVNPYTTDEFYDDLQFVVEIEGPTEDSRTAEFVSGEAIGCDNNKRASGRLLSNQAAMTLQINDPTAKLRLWGGWATGHNAVRLTPELILEPGQQTIEEVEQSIEELEEEIGEEEFRNSNEEKAIRKQAEEQLQKLLNEESDSASKKETTKKRKRKNLLEKPGNIPEGLFDKSKKTNDLGLEIARSDKEGASQGRAIPENPNQKQFDLNSKKTAGRARKRHTLTDHTTTHRNRRDVPENIGIGDDQTDDDLPAVGEVDPVIDDALPFEGDLDDDGGSTRKVKKIEKKSLRREKRRLDDAQHFLACIFFAASMTLILTIFRKKRDKGRRDL